MSRTGEKGFIVNTNRSEERAYHSEKYMLEKGKALVTGEDWFKQIDKIEENDMVFLYANEEGIIARGIATGETCEVATEEAFKVAPGNPFYEQFRGVRARCVKLRDFDKLSKPIKVSESPVRFGVRRAVTRIRSGPPQKIWDFASGRLR